MTPIPREQARDNDSEGMHLLFLLPVAPSIELLLDTISASSRYEVVIFFSILVVVEWSCEVGD